MKRAAILAFLISACGNSSIKTGAPEAPACTDDSRCPPGTYCVADVCQAFPAACRTHFDCSRGETCADGFCTLACTSGAACAGGTACNEETGLCDPISSTEPGTSTGGTTTPITTVDTTTGGGSTTVSSAGSATSGGTTGGSTGSTTSGGSGTTGGSTGGTTGGSTGTTGGSTGGTTSGSTGTTGVGSGTSGGSGSTTGGVTPPCTNDTWANFASSFFAKDCVSCHSFASSYSGVHSNTRISSAISSGSMPPNGSLSASDKQRVLAWIGCGMPQ